MDNLLHETELLSDIASRVGSATNADDLFDGIAEFICQVFDVRIALLALPDPIEPHLALRKTLGLPSDAPKPTWHFDDDSVIPTVHRIGATFFSNALLADERVLPQDVVRGWGFHSMMAAPIVNQQQVVGVLAVARKDAIPFQEPQLSVLKLVAAQVGLAIGQIDIHRTLLKQSYLMEQVNQIGSNLTAILDFDPLFEHVVAAIHRDLRYEAVGLWLREGPDVVARARAIDGHTSLVESENRHPVTEGIVGRAVRTARSYISRDLQQDSDYIPSDAWPHLRSALTVPVRSGDKVLGALIVLGAEGGRFDTIDRMAMETLAAQVAIATENARLYRETQQRLLEQRIIHQIGAELNSIFEYPALREAIVFHMTQALGTTGCSLYLYDPELNSLAYQAHYASQQASRPDALKKLLPSYSLNDLPATRQMIHKGTPVAFHIGQQEIPPTALELLTQLGQQSALMIPLAVAGRTLGLLAWVKNEFPREFADADVRLAQTLANQVAVVLDHIRLFDETRRQLRRETVLRRVAETASTWTDQTAMFAQYAREVNKALNTSACTIYMLDEKGQLVPQTQQTATGVGPIKQGGTPLRMDDYPSLKTALVEGAVFSVTLGDASPTLPEGIRVRDLGFTGMLVAPLIYRDILVGAVEVLDWRVNYRFTVDDITMLEALAHQPSTATQSFLLYQEEQRQRALLERIQETSQAIAGELRQQPLLNLIVEKVSQVFDREAAAIVLPHTEGDLWIVASYGLSENFVQHFKISESRVLELHGEEPTGVVFEDIREISKAQLELMEVENLRTVMSIPLLHARGLVGSLAVITRDKPRTFSRHELEMAQLLGRQIAIAINNARLFELQEERAAELALANRLKNEFLANISHELRTPMNSIIGFSDSLLAGMHGELTEKQRSRMEVVARNAHQLLKLIDDLIDLSNLEAGRMELAYIAFDPRELLMSLEIEYAPRAKEKGLEFSYSVADEMPRLWSDTRRLRQVFHNLLSNAIKFTEQGSVTIEARPERVYGRLFAHFAIKDTGIGIAPQDQDIIFDAFRQVDGSMTREYEGTGMGLTITHRLIRLMEGTIEVESEVGKGTTFHVRVPAVENERN